MQTIAPPNFKLTIEDNITMNPNEKFEAKQTSHRNRNYVVKVAHLQDDSSAQLHEVGVFIVRQDAALDFNTSES